MNRDKIRRVNALAAFSVAASFCMVPVQGQSVEDRLKALEAQNKLLQEQLAAQRDTIDDLKRRLESGSSSETAEEPRNRGGIDFGPVHITGEGGVGYFHTGSDGAFPSSSFRVDEAKLFLEAPVWEGTYLFSELDLVIREANDEFFHLGELYIDFENILRRWTDKNYLSIRAGRLDIPFGEEYSVRDVIDNPLISHSLSDLWGIDEGVELYGNAYGFDYVVAVQNGGHPTLKDFDSDKSVAGRVGYNFGQRARLSFSGMRTGKLSVANDRMSELWFGGGFFRGIGAPDTTTTYEAQVFELDGQTFWKTGHLKFAAGYFEYGDDDSSAQRERDGYYYYAEGVQKITNKLYAAGRFSHILTDDGMPLVGNGDFGKYFFGPLTRDLWRLSIGLGYRLSDNLVAKIEYTLEQGELTSGTPRDRHNFFGAQLGFKF